MVASQARPAYIYDTTLGDWVPMSGVVDTGQAYTFTANQTFNGLVTANNGINAATTLSLQTGGVNRMSIDSGGRVTTPNNPAFSAYVGGAAQNTALPSGSTVPYNTATINIGSCYNTSTYRFTAPVAGTYLLSVYDIGATTSTSRFFLFRNGVDLEANNTVHQLRAPNGANYSSALSFWLVTAAVNDFFYVTVNEGTSYATNEYAWFSGFLVG
jgi:hypothetical protein